MKTSGNTILITGGGSGIGEALGQRFHDRGNVVIVAGRRMDALNQAIDGRENMHAMVLDVDDVGAIETFAHQVTERFPALNVLLNNAGIMRIEPLDRKRDLRDTEETITTNLLGPIRMINALVEHLAAQDDSAIVNFSSGLAFVPLIDAAAYSATKAGIHFYTVALRAALAGKVEVIELAPPGVQTTLTPGQEHRPGYMPLDTFADEAMALFQQQPTPPEILVDQVKWQRNAEAENRFDATFKEMNERARAARKASGG